MLAGESHSPSESSPDGKLHNLLTILSRKLHNPSCLVKRRQASQSSLAKQSIDSTAAKAFNHIPQVVARVREGSFLGKWFSEHVTALPCCQLSAHSIPLGSSSQKSICFAPFLCMFSSQFNFAPFLHDRNSPKRATMDAKIEKLAPPCDNAMTCVILIPNLRVTLTL